MTLHFILLVLTWSHPPDTWHMTCDTWWRVNIFSILQLPSSSGLGVVIFWRFWGKASVNEWVNELINDKGVLEPPRLHLVCKLELPWVAFYCFLGSCFSQLILKYFLSRNFKMLYVWRKSDPRRLSKVNQGSTLIWPKEALISNPRKQLIMTPTAYFKNI